MADEEGVLAEGDQVVAEYGESDGVCGRCTCLCPRCPLGNYTCACTVCSSEDGAESIPEEPEVVDEAVHVFRGHTGTCACVGCNSCVLQSEAVNRVLLQTRCLLWRGALPRRAW